MADVGLWWVEWLVAVVAIVVLSVIFLIALVHMGPYSASALLAGLTLSVLGLLFLEWPG